jgi:hypothetical protein
MPMTNNTERKAFDSMSVVHSIANTLKKGGSKLSEDQLMLMHGAMAVWFGEIQKAALAQREQAGVDILRGALEKCDVPRSYQYAIIGTYRGMLSAAPAPSLCTAEEAAELVDSLGVGHRIHAGTIYEREELAAIINADRAKR